MKKITLTGFKGGVGKSTTAVNLAAYFSKFGKNLLIDGDPNHTAIAWSNRGTLPFEVVSSHQSLKAVSSKDCIFDTPVRPNSQDLAELINCCDLLILPTCPDIVSIVPMVDIVKALANANYRLIIALVPPNPSKDGDTAQTELRQAGYAVFKSTICRPAAVTNAASTGTTVRDCKFKALPGPVNFEF